MELLGGAEGGLGADFITSWARMYCYPAFSLEKQNGGTNAIHVSPRLHERYYSRCLCTESNCSYWYRIATSTSDFKWSSYDFKLCSETRNLPSNGRHPVREFFRAQEFFQRKDTLDRIQWKEDRWFKLLHFVSEWRIQSGSGWQAQQIREGCILCSQNYGRGEHLLVIEPYYS